MNKLKNSPLVIPGMSQNILTGNINIDQQKILTIEPQRQISLRKLSRWTYTVVNNHPDVTNDFENGYIRDVISVYSSFICKLYLGDVPTYTLETLPSENMEPSEIQSMTNRVVRLSKKLIKSSSRPELICRLISKDYSVSISISIGKDDGITFTIALFDGYRKICKCSSVLISGSDNNKLFMDAMGTPMYFTKKDRDVEKVFNTNKMNGVNIFNLQIVYHALKMMENNESIDKDIYRNYSDTEIYIINSIMKDYLKVKMWPKDLSNWVNPNCDPTEYLSFNQMDKMSIDFVRNTISNNDLFPMIDISEKESNFIINYAERNKFINGKDSKVFNLLPYMINPSYGESFQYPIEYEDGSKNIITTSYMIDDMNNLRIYIMQKINDSCVVFSWVNFKDIENFHVVNSLTHMNSSILITDIENLTPRGEDLLDSIPSEFLDMADIVDTISEIISLHIVIHDRPTRTRMVRCSSRIKKETSKIKKDTKVEYDFVVTRILKTVLDAKEYVSRMSTDGHIDREYSLESWNRKGYYRRLKGGGAVWIPATTCHRHLPLSEKELHIKL